MPTGDLEAWFIANAKSYADRFYISHWDRREIGVPAKGSKGGRNWCLNVNRMPLSLGGLTHLT
jgi:hypothetical protein